MQEQTYFHLSEQLFTLMNDCLLEFWQGRKPNLTSFAKDFKIIHIQMQDLEAHKYLPPKFSSTCKELSTYLAEQSPKSLPPRRSPSPSLPKASKPKNEKSRHKLPHERGSKDDSPPTATLVFKKTPSSPFKIRRSSYYDSIFNRALYASSKKNDIQAAYFPYNVSHQKEPMVLPVSQLI